MNEITYSYEIISADPVAKVMEIIYTSEGRQTMHIGARLPYVGESLEAIVQMYAPVRFWQEREAEVLVPEIGKTGTVVPPETIPPTQAQIQAQFEQAIQFRLDSFARTRGYDNVNAVSKYQNITDDEIAALPTDYQPYVTRFRAECRYMAIAAATTWAKAYEILAAVQSGTRPMPISPDEVFSELPVLEWPV